MYRVLQNTIHFQNKPKWWIVIYVQIKTDKIFVTRYPPIALPDKNKFTLFLVSYKLSKMCRVCFSKEWKQTEEFNCLKHNELQTKN